MEKAIFQACNDADRVKNCTLTYTKRQDTIAIILYTCTNVMMAAHCINAITVFLAL